MGKKSGKVEAKTGSVFVVGYPMDWEEVWQGRSEDQYPYFGPDSADAGIQGHIYFS